MTALYSLKRKTGLLIAFAISLIPIATAIITVNYLGLSFGDETELDPKNWQRKWLIFFAWFYIVSYSLALLFVRV